METGLQKYLGDAVSVLDRLGIPKVHSEESRLATLLEEVKNVDEPSVVAIAGTVRYAGDFNQLVRDNVREIKLADRYQNITEMFDGIREDTKKLAKQLEDGKIDGKEKIENAWMKLTRGSPHKRFERIRDTYLAVSDDTGKALKRENDIINAYVNFRFALKETEAIARELLKKEEAKLEEAKTKYNTASDEVTKYEGKDDATRSKLELARDEANRALRDEDRKYQLIKDVAENITIGYNVGDTLVAKLQQTHDVKDQVYRRSITFFQTNEHVFTTLDAVYSSQHGLHETTETLKSMETGANKGIEDVAEMGGKLEKAGLEAAYGATINKDSVKKLVDSIVQYQLDSKQIIEKARIESANNARDIESIVNDGKERSRQAMLNYSQAKAA